jgi:hypothetical protein
MEEVHPPRSLERGGGVFGCRDSIPVQLSWEDEMTDFCAPAKPNENLSTRIHRGVYGWERGTNLQALIVVVTLQLTAIPLLLLKLHGIY